MPKRIIVHIDGGLVNLVAVEGLDPEQTDVIVVNSDTEDFPEVPYTEEDVKPSASFAWVITMGQLADYQPDVHAAALEAIADAIDTHPDG